LPPQTSTDKAYSIKYSSNKICSRFSGRLKHTSRK